MIPDDGKDSGICLDGVISFEVDLRGDEDKEELSNIDMAFRNQVLVGLIIILLILFGTLALILRKNRQEKRLKRYLASSPKSPVPSSIRNTLLSSRTLRALRAGGVDHDSDDFVELPEKRVDKMKDTDDPEYGIGTMDKDTSIIRAHARPFQRQILDDEKGDGDSDGAGVRGPRAKLTKPYAIGEYEPSHTKLRYRPPSKLAPNIKRAIPYARGSKKDDQISTKDKIALAKPISKKITTDKPLKASSLPITKECPHCGSFKVKTYKDETSRCLDCKFRF